MKWDACILLLALGKMPYVFPSVDEFEVSRSLSQLRFKFFVWIISGSETILRTADVEFGPRLFAWYRERRVLNDLTVVNSTEPVWIRIRFPNSDRGGTNSFSMETIVQLIGSRMDRVYYFLDKSNSIFLDNFYCARISNERIFLFFLKIVVSIRLYT